MQHLKEKAVALADLGYRLYAENKRSVLLVLQGLDAAGEDGTIRYVMRGLNPQNCQVPSFKQPRKEELDHNFLWRIHKAVPSRGNMDIFNRSQCENVLVVRLHNLVPEVVWKSRYDRINNFEKLLIEASVVIVKCFLHISKEEQRERLQARLDDPKKRWNIRLGDLEERKPWDDYQLAYQTVLNRCNTELAPWYIIPSDRKWYRNLAVSNLLLRTMSDMDPQYPPAEKGLDGVSVI